MNREIEESIGQLDRLRSEGQFEVAKKALEEGHPLLRMAGLERPELASALDRNPNQLESVGVRPPLLEAIVAITNRPPMTVRNGKVELVDLATSDFGAGIKDKIIESEIWLPSVGRIEFINHDMDWGGTGWVIGEDEKMPGHLLVATNRHVAVAVAQRNRRGEGVYLYAPQGGVRYSALIDFNEEVGADAGHARECPILKFTYLAEDTAADVAIGRIAIPAGFGISPMPLAETDGVADEPIAVIGYPARDERVPQSVAHMERYFQGLYDIKRYCVGLLKGGGPGVLLRHDATTLGGNSGSPVFSLDKQAVVGLHFQGMFGRYNSAVRVSTLRDIIAGGRTNILVRGLPSPAESEADEELRDGTHSAEDLKDRDGYDPNFLGVNVPWPTLPADTFDLARPSDALPNRPHELRYTHFGVLYCASHRTPAVTAVNIDGELSRPLKRTRDRWFFDLRIDRNLQIGQEDYGNVDCDRGHLVKREDPNWGDPAVVERANFDTFHYPNAAPQHAGLNRSRAMWLGLETYIISSARTHKFRASVFSGPVLNDDVVEIDGVTVPLEFWKVVVMMTADEDDETSLRPHATAYVLSQGRLIHQMLIDRNRNEAVEGFEFGEFKTFQVAIADLEQATGLGFGNLTEFDPMRLQAEESAFFEPTMPLYREIGDFDRIIL